jgi:hypothetical protein
MTQMDWKNSQERGIVVKSRVEIKGGERTERGKRKRRERENEEREERQRK